MFDQVNQKRKPSLFLILAITGLAAVLTGFARTFIIPVSSGTFKAPFSIYLHGAFAFSWIALFVVQAFLIHVRRYKLHMTLGIVGIIIALGTAITMVPAGVFEVNKSLKNGAGEMAYSGIVGTCTSGILFLSFVLCAVYYRNRPDVHKRLMLLSTIIVLWPAWFRFRHFFPSVPRPDIWFGVVLADSLIIIAWILDKIANGKIHRTLLWGGLIIIIENILEILLFDSSPWRATGKYIYHLVT